MRKFLKILLIFTLAFELCACGKQEELPLIESSSNESESPFAIGGDSKTTMLGYKFGLVDFPQKCVYSGNPIEFDLYYQNGSFAVETGLLIFVDGIPQTYSVSGKNKPRVMQKFDLGAGEKQTVHVTFEPNTGKNSDVLSLQFASILNPSFIAEQGENYGNNHRLLELAPTALTFEADAKAQDFSAFSIEKSALIDDDILKRYFLTSAAAADTHTLRLYDNFSSAEIFSKHNEKVLLTLEDFGGATAQYRTTIFVDNAPIKINNSFDFTDYRLSEGNFVRQTVEISIENPAEKHSIYAVSVPVGTSSSGSICISNSSTVFPVGTAQIVPENNSEQLSQTENSNLSFGGDAVDLSAKFGGTISFFEKIGDCIYTVENYRSIVKYTSDFRKIKSADFNENLLFLNAKALENGVAVFSQPESENGLFCTIYDSELNELKIDVYSLLEISRDDYISPDEIDISPSGKSVIYIGYNKSDESCIYSRRISDGEKNVLFTDDEFCFVSVRFAKNGDIAYTADSYASGSRREFAGIISAGKKLAQQYFKNCEFSGSAQNTVLFDERNVKSGEHSSGKILSISSSGECKTIGLNSPDESQHAYLSPSGNRIITYLEQDGCCRFSVYDNEKILSERSVNYPNFSNVCVSGISFVGEREIVVIFSAGTRQKIYQYSF